MLDEISNFHLGPFYVTLIFFSFTYIFNANVDIVYIFNN